MLGYFTRKRIIALFFSVLFTISHLIPIQVFSLTTGPSQPEMTGFQPAGVGDMVDVFTGDFKYNIPLLDVDGYPVNLAYQSGIGIDDEASWVGLGWSLNVGSINRQLRGVPDDFSGDKVTNDFYQKPKVTIGGDVFVKPEFKGNLGPALSGKFSLGVFNDNYTGIGASVGANAGIDISLINAPGNTVGLGLNAGLGITSNTSSGVDVSPSVSLSVHAKVVDNFTVSSGLSTSLGYNTRSGLKSLTLGRSFSLHKLSELGRNNENATLDLGGSSYNFNTEPFYPKPQVSYYTSSASFTPAIGGAAFMGFVGAGGTGYVNVREVKERVVKKPAYGFLYAERGKDVPEALMDFTREKDNIIIPELPNLAVPVHTPDLFSFSSQTGFGQFRLYRGGTGILFDDLTKDESKSISGGVDYGFGAYFHGGVSLYDQKITSATQKWTMNNSYLEKGDFQQNAGENPNDDPVYFKQVGEKTISNEEVESIFQNEKPVAVNISNKAALQQLKFNTSVVASVSEMKKTAKAVKRAAISFLTAGQASRGGALDKKLKNFVLLNDQVNPQTAHSFDEIDRTGILNYRKPNHISEFTVTDEVGKRMVYGLPVYNKLQQEYTFNVGTAPQNGLDRDKNLVNIPKDALGKISTIGKGVDEYYTKQTQPAYATSFLLTGILSPDYVDLNSDGITDDDRGTAIKFNYSKMPDDFKWRTPLQQGKASYNQGLLADHEDEKGNIIYGEKELWYMQSIETKTKIAYFVLGTRDDALGVLDWNGGINTTKKQKFLKKIVLYSKADLTKPIKTVELNYDYQLCKGVPNYDPAGSDPDKGKLTLTKLLFKYGNSPKGLNHSYKFNYSNTANYDALVSDRWGTYKAKLANEEQDIILKNDEYPYTVQNKAKADNYSSQWLLNKIELPTGGVINVTYESDDYAYVQNKRAMKMVQPVALVKENNENANLKEAKKIVINISDNPGADEDQRKWFKDKYLNGSDYIYGKLYVKISTKALLMATGYQNDFVVGYAKVDNVVVNNGVAYIRLGDITEGGVTVNPFCVAAWQKMRSEYPKYAYPGYENRPTQADPIGNFKATVSAIFNAFKNLGELKESFYERANRKNFATEVNLSKSFFRITDQTGKKFGGGCRVKKLTISDEWNAMSSESGNTVVYGTEYNYTTIENQKTISSGVASFEPSALYIYSEDEIKELDLSNTCSLRAFPCMSFK
jgi:hypothetical protein